MQIHIPYHAESVSVIFCNKENLPIKMPTNQISNNLWELTDVPEHNWFYYLIDDSFAVCDPKTDQCLEIANSIFASVTLRSDDKTTVESRSVVCSRINKDSLPIEKRNIFSYQDPLAIIQLTIQSIGSSIAVVTTEWMLGKKRFWLTSKPFRVNGIRHTFAAMNITDQLPPGDWNVNVYIDNKFVDRVYFKIIQTGNGIAPSSAFIDMKC